MSNKQKIIVAGALVTIISIITVGSIMYTRLTNLEEQQVAIINSLGSAGVLEQQEAGGEITVNRVVRYKDLPQPDQTAPVPPVIP